ncbi:MAG: carboxypeptidase regulatory-like domain-containing protein [Pyrinomonadaceae bacterium]|nr:carboxypeptidase regulatory-like domain-containing protein [Pyrinomonadaceae bacterium]MBP6213966.1 carboxypeptidase regulatory-like domain-containing protein [Pyrinomonadaceae bacterium]
MRVYPSKASAAVTHILLFMAAIMVFSVAAMAQAQATAADLSGTVVDPSGAVVAGATVSAKNVGTNTTRTVVSGPDGDYQFIGLPPGEYEITAQASSFKRVVISPVKLTVGQSASLQIKMEVGGQDIVVNVSGDDIQLIETTRTTVSNTIDQARINNLPINERSATGFALTISTVGRDNGRPVGPAPTSGLNIGGQRGRSTLVQVDGADFTDNSINAARSTVSQEAVQEYQVTTNSYMPEFGRATGGIVNVVTKRGTNAFTGNVFGFLRDKSFQAKNAFAPIIDNDPNKKPGYTRAQYGATLGGPIAKEKAFFFIAFEQRRRQESGFFTGDIVGGATSSITIGAPILPFTQTFTGMTPAQVGYVQGLIASGVPANISQAVSYAYLTSAGTQTALNGGSTLISAGGAIPAGQTVGNRFFLSGTPVPLTRNAAGQYIAFRPLSQLARIFPISESTTYYSARYDQALTETDQLSVRLGFNPSRINGIQDESQNQTLGQNDYSRTGIQDLKDVSAGFSVTSILPRNLINEFYFNFGRRDAKFDSQIPSVALQIAGTGFIGSNPFSPVNRRENRYQVRDNMTWATKNHIVKFGFDMNYILGRASFELNFPALFNFGQQSCSSLIAGCTGPALTAIQSYGLGFPSVFIQGFGDPNSTIKNKPIAFFAQDTWKISHHFTFNYGVRYDIELTDEFAPTSFRDPLTGITLSQQDVQTAQDALNITQGFPRDRNNIAPRVGFAWDIGGNGKTVIRAAGGMFYDHPLLTVSFNSNVADGSQQQQATLLPIGGPSPTGLFNAFQVMHGTVCGVQGSAAAICGAAVTPGVASSAQYLFGQMRFNSSNFTGFGPILPFTLHVSKDFQYPYAMQGNLAIEQMIGKDMSLSASYITVNARHLAHPQDVNQVNLTALTDNFRRYTANNPLACGGPCGPNGRAPSNLSEAAFFSMPTVSNALYTVVIPGLIAVNNTTGLRIVSPIVANYFRRLGPNYFFASAVTGGAVNKAVLDAQLAGSLRTTGPINPYADVNAQLSDGNSSYNALNIELKKRFSNSFQFYATYTWSHSIDDSSDLQTLLKPQDNNNFRAERSDSLFDQRHRFVISGIISAPDRWKSGSGFQQFMHGFSLSPIVEYGSGRPFNILAVGDSNGDFQSTNERPTVRSDGSLCATGVDTNCFQNVFPLSGNLGRNMGITHNYFSVDARLTKKIRFGERYSLDLIAEGFNLFNRFNEAAANPFYQVVNQVNERSGGKYYSRSTSAFDPRQFQFGLKLNF